MIKNKALKTLSRYNYSIIKKVKNKLSKFYIKNFSNWNFCSVSLKNFFLINRTFLVGILLMKFIILNDYRT